MSTIYYDMKEVKAYGNESVWGRYYHACTFFMKKKPMHALYKPVSERIINKILSEGWGMLKGLLYLT